MASALLASRNEPYLGERKVYMRKNPNPNHSKTSAPGSNNPNPKERPPFEPPNPTHARKADDSPADATASVSDDSSSFNRRSDGLNHHQRESAGGYVTFNITSYSREELRDLKRRLISELEQVRRLSSGIESRDFQSIRSACYSASGNYGGGREVTSATTRPPALHLNLLPPLDSPSLAVGSGGSKEKRTPKANQLYRPSEFVTGKDKTVSPLPAESHNKKLSGGKRPMLVVSPREVKRPVVAAESEKLLSGMMNKCGQILTKLMKHKHGWVFNVPVDVEGMKLHDYNQIIKHPMDLGTVKSKLSNNVYLSPIEFAADIRLTFNNAFLYNPKGHDVYMMAEQLLNLFEGLFGPAWHRYEQQSGNSRVEGEEGGQRSYGCAEISTVEAVKRTEPATASLIAAQPAMPPPTPVPAAAPAPKPQPPATMVRTAVGKQPKPKAKDPHKREMSLDEKQKLSFGLQSLPQEKMAQVLQIVRRRNLIPVQHDDEIELDFEVLDTETLWELDRFVCNCKKMMSKMRRQEAMSSGNIPADAAPSSAYVDKVVSEPPVPAAAARKNKRGEPGDEDVDIGEEMPSTHFPPVEIEKDSGYASRSNSSSSSSSDSSSSDSDSGSSSVSDSDAAGDAESPAVGLRPSPGN